MHPILIDWNGIVIPAWHTMFALGAVAIWAVLVSLRRYVVPDIAMQQLATLYLVGYAGGYFGARIFSIIVEEDSGGSLSGFMKLLVSLGPMTFYGGALGGATAAYLFAVWRRFPKRRLLDAVIPAILVGLGIGRIGCFLNGCDYGCAVTPSWWTVVPPVMDDGLARIPVQLIESVFCLVLGASIAWRLIRPSAHWRHDDQQGMMGFFGIAAYAVFRFMIEYWRCDDRGWVIQDVLSPAQAVSIGLLIFVGVTVIVTRPWLRGPKAGANP